MIIVIYSKNTGMINRVTTCPEIMAYGQCMDGEDYLEVDSLIDAHNFYVSQGRLAQRQQQGATIDKAQCAANGVDAVTISGLSDIANMEIATPWGVTLITHPASGSAVLTFDLAGEYRVVSKHWPYLDQEFVINAV